ncbi:MAG: hypothetical protein QM756_03080 [Polyangiaceae bacterium]
MEDKRPLYYALAIGIVMLTAAVSYRIVKTDGDIDVQGSKDGIQVKITQAQETIDSAQQELSELGKQLDQRQAALEKAEAELRARQDKVTELLGRLEKMSDKPKPAQVKAVQAELDTLGKAPTPSIAVASNDEQVKTRVAKLTELQRKLSVTSSELKASSKVPVKQ